MSTRSRLTPRRLVLAAALLATAFVLPALAAAVSAPDVETPPPFTAPAYAPVDGAACPDPDPVTAAILRAQLFRFTEDPTGGEWLTWHVDPDAIAPGAPPAMGSVEQVEELAELHEYQLARTDEQVLQAQIIADGPATRQWTELMLALIVEHSNKDGSKNPPRLARQFAMLETAMFDALAATWKAKYCHNRLPPSAVDPLLMPVIDVHPLPSYPSEHAAVAAAAAKVMKTFFPCPDPLHCEEDPAFFDALVANVTESRLVAGANYRSDVEAGLAIGNAAGQAVLDARANDGAYAPWDGSGRITGPCNWTPTLPNFGGPVEPMWGKVRPFVLTTGSQFRPGPPPACDSPTYVAQTQDIHDARVQLTARQIEVAKYWAGGPGTVTPPGMWLNLALNETIDRDLSTMHTSRVMAHTSASLADAGIASWDAKYTYWGDRPIHGIRRLIDPTWKPLIGTPPFPGYISGHSTFGGAATQVLSYFFPEDRTEFRSYATEAAMSRFYGGIHIRADNDVGLTVGENVGGLVCERAAGDGAPGL